MAVQKAFAYLFVNGTYQLISAVEAIDRRSSQKKSIYYDSKNEDKRRVFVSRNKKTPSFHYYRTEKIEFLDKSKPMTREHRLFQEGLSKIKRIKIAPYNRKEKTPTVLYVKEWHVEYKLEDNRTGKYFRIDALAQLNGTYPFSLYYGWNSCLAIEVKVTHEVDDFKSNQLGRIGAKIFEVNVPKKIKNLITENYYYSDQELVTCIVGELEKESTILYGEFINRATILEEYEERYIKMANFEREIEQLKENKNQIQSELTELATKLTLYQEKKEELSVTYFGLQEKMKACESELNRLHIELEQARKADKEEYKTKAANLKKENEAMNQKFQKIKNFSFFDRFKFLFDGEIIDQLEESEQSESDRKIF
ncbi:hypothetical protein A5819_003742 [Enterococcus sp. 7E2_DIV0204]|uniref:hypothetical protein n=1 Tax=unclassified Enterococcus TaxID=2608891 RepID=UPI000A349D50|nr:MULTISPECIES: hypothetical protein [unclassified Enterococcus]OTN83762.1 hypothetical protein A5819_003742 [Enterococcus sp. 7E2_DIV0204]OTP47133.1 hypothetical protein A5884_003670 [Enterococcus sp. 7D2_DIV0200]